MAEIESFCYASRTSWVVGHSLFDFTAGFEEKLDWWNFLFGEAVG